MDKSATEYSRLQMHAKSAKHNQAMHSTPANNVPNLFRILQGFVKPRLYESSLFRMGISVEQAVIHVTVQHQLIKSDWHLTRARRETGGNFIPNLMAMGGWVD